MKRRILVYSPNPLDGVSYYRQWGPLSALHDKLECVSFSNDTAAYTNWVNYLNYDCALLSRPNKYNDYFFAQECKKFGLPLWVDYDDDLFNITPDNPVYHTFASDQTRKYISEVLKMADVVTVATNHNKIWLEKNLELKNVVIIPNAMDHRFLNYKKPFKASKRIAWRGGDSHRQDIFYYTEEIASTINKHPTHDWVFFGMFAPIIDEKCEKTKIRWAKPVNIMDFIVEFTKFNPKIVFVPLIDNQFNRVKSNLAWLDATLAGSVCLAPDWEEWQKPGIILYSDKKDFGAQLEGLTGCSDFELKRQHDESFEFIKDNLLLSKINDIRMELINNLIAKKGIYYGKK